MVKKSSTEDKKSDAEIKYKGVRKRKWGKWVSEIRLPNSRERIWLGSYDSPVKAARAFDAAQFCLRGKSANFNFPDDPPEIAGGTMTRLEIQAAAARFANTTASKVVVSGGEDDPMVRDDSEDYSLSYSPSISDGTTVQMDGLDMIGVEMSFHEELSLSTTLGPGNYVSDFGFFAGFDEFTGCEYYPIIHQHDNFEYGAQYDTYDATLYQDSNLWSF